jgi:hypothetical protein
VDDFDGFFQRLPLPPGEHEVVLYMPGYRTTRQKLYLSPAKSFKLRYNMEPLAAGETAEPPPVAPPVPAPPQGSAFPPHTPEPGRPGGPAPASIADFGSIAVRVQPAGADVVIDGERWSSSDDERLVVQLAAGRHRVEIHKNGYRGFSSDVVVRGGETATLNVSLSPEK